MNETKNIEKNYNIAKTLAPLLHASLVKKRSLKELFVEVDNSINDIINESDLYKNLNNREKEKIIQIQNGKAQFILFYSNLYRMDY